MIKKVLLTSALVASFAATAYAADSSEGGPQVTLGGSLDTQLGYAQQKKQFRHSVPGDTKKSKLNNHSLVNDAKLSLKIVGEADAGFKYGAEIKLNADTSKAKEEFYDGAHSSKAQQTMGYVEGGFGRFVMGNYTGVTETMQVGASTIARATGGVNGDARYWWNNISGATKGALGWDENGMPKIISVNAGLPTSARFLEAPTLPTNELGFAGIKGKNAGKISYYTPSFSGFMFGVSYTPDLGSYGTIANAKTVTSSTVTTGAPKFKNIWEGGLYYENVFDQFGVKASLTGETGTAKKINNGVDLSKKYRTLRAYEAGLNVSYMGFTVGGSYGDWGKSMLTKESNAKGTKYWTAGAGYEYGPFGVSLTYANTQRGVLANAKKNKLELISLGLDYKLAPGFMPYAEATYFKNKDRAVDAITKEAVGSNKGAVFLLGSKLQF